MKKYLITLSILLIAFLSNSCGGKNETSSSNEEASIKVSVNIANPKDNSSYITASGKIISENSADLSTRIMGFVNTIYVNVGDKVTKGQLLLSINSSDLLAKRAQLNASITKATAAYNIAEKDYIRFKNLYEDNSASQKEMDDMTANFEMSKAGLEAAKQMKKEIDAQFAYSNIRAPFKGVVTNRFIEEGDMANPGVTLISVESPGAFEVIASIPESEISNIRNDQDVSIQIKSINKKVSGKVSEISSSSRNTGGQYLVRVRLIETDTDILSGMFASIDFPIEKTIKGSNLILISKDALVHKGQLSGVYTIKDNETAILRWLRLGRDYGESVEVLSGLNAFEEYIVSADGKLYNGAKVSIQQN